MVTNGTFETLVLDESHPGVLIVELHRPEVLNAYNRTMCTELAACIDGFTDAPQLRVLVLTGAGRAFCAGGDVSASSRADDEDRDRPLGRAMEIRFGMHRVARALDSCDKPVLAMVNGPAVSGGLALALLCDYRIGSDEAVLGDRSGDFGLLPDEGGAWLLPQAMGLDHALMMSWTGAVLDASAARERGLLSEVVPASQLGERTLRLAQELVDRPELATRATKSMMRRSLRSSFTSSLGDAEMSVMFVNTSDETRERLARFRERR